MSELSNPHDTFVKSALSRPEVARDFLRNYLPPKLAAAIDLRTLEALKDSFIDADLKKHFSDLLFRVRFKGGSGKAYLYLLFEHKSSPETFVALQLLRYELRIWEEEARSKVKKLTPIFPLVFYHGRKKWKVDLRFGALLEVGEHTQLRDYLPDFLYHLCDLSAYSDDEIKGAAVLRVSLLVLKYIFSQELGERLPEIFELLRQMPQQSALEFLQTVLKYLIQGSHSLQEAEIEQALESAFSEPEGGIMSTIAETWERRGLERGLQQGSATLTLLQLENRLGSLDGQTQERIRGLSIEQLEKLGVALLDFKSTEDLTRWMRKHLRKS